MYHPPSRKALEYQYVYVLLYLEQTTMYILPLHGIG